MFKASVNNITQESELKDAILKNDNTSGLIFLLLFISMVHPMYL